MSSNRHRGTREYQYLVPGLECWPQQFGAALGEIVAPRLLAEEVDLSRVWFRRRCRSRTSVHREGEYASPSTRYRHTGVLLGAVRAGVIS